jgi:hypothetical protein
MKIKGRGHYFLVGLVIGSVLSLGIAWAGLRALQYYRQGVGLGYAKAYTKIFFKKAGASESQVGRFKGGGRGEKIEVIKELILAQRERLPWVKKEKRIPLAFSNTTFVASSLDRIFPDGFVLRKATSGSAIGILAAKNEFESFQVVVKGGQDVLKAVRLEMGDLKNEKTGSLIPQAYVSWRVVGNVLTQKPYYSVKYVGLWPDPLLSLNVVDVLPGVFQSFWVTVYVPKNADSGVYRGRVKVLAGDGVLAEIPVLLRVFNFALSLESHLKTAFDFYGHITASRYPRRDDETPEGYQLRIQELNEKYVLDMLAHRMNPILNIDPASDQDMARAEQYRRFGLNNFSIGNRGGTFNNNWPSTDEEIEQLKSVYEMYSEKLQMSGLRDFSYIYTWDEGEIGAPIVKKITSMIHQASPKLKNMVCYHGFWDPQKDPDWGKDIDIWCFGMGDFNEIKMKVLKDLGMEMWTYVSGPGGSGYPNLAIDFDSIDYRIIPWLCWKHDIKGFLYWCVNWWPYADPFKTAMNTKWNQNGNGLLFYPGEDGPIDSLRLEIFRDGMEDYEYLYLLKQKVEEAKKKNLDPAVISKYEKLLTIDKSIVESMWKFTKDTRQFLKYREAVAEAIEELGKI